MAEAGKIFTIGHSNHEIGRFLELLGRHGISVVADVRSQPFSRFTPQFNRDVLMQALKPARVQYVFMGRELGARREESQCYVRGKARYELIAGTALFAEGVERLRKGMETHRVALLCAEKDPITCHRMILVSRHLRGEAEIGHILEDGSMEANVQAEDRLMELLGLPAATLFEKRETLVERAYDLQGERIAYVTQTETAGAAGHE